MIDTASLSPWLFVITPIVVIVGYTIFGLSGFGSTAITVPILAHFLPVSYLVPLMVGLDLASALLLGSASREHVSRDEVKRIVPWMFVGFVAGVTVLVGVPDQHLRVALGVFATVVGVYSIFNPKLTRTISKLWVIPAGISGGAVATIFGAGGPIYSTYLSGRISDKHQIRATMSTLISISAFSRAILYAISGLLLHAAVAVGMVVLSPFVWLGLKLGNRIHVGLTQEQMRRALGCMLVVIGLSLLARTLA